MSHNLEWVNASEMGGKSAGQSAGQSAAPPFGEGQRQSWMLEMERALLAANGVKVVPVGPGADGNRAGSNLAARLAPSGRAAAMDLLGGAVGGYGFAALGLSNGANAAGPLVPTVSTLSTVSTTATPSVTGLGSVVAQASPVSAVSASATVAAGLGAREAGGLANALGGEGGLPHSNSAAANLGNQANLPTLLPVVPAGLVHSLQVGQIAQIGQAAALALSSTPTPLVGLNPLAVLLPELSSAQSHLGLLAGGTQPPSESGQALAEAGQDESQNKSQNTGQNKSQNTGLHAGFEAAAAARSAMQDTWAKRQLHLYPGADGVQAWIRDAGLNPVQVQAVAQALRQELHGSGMKLKTLTVNGHPLERLERPENWPQADMNGDTSQTMGEPSAQQGIYHL